MTRGISSIFTQPLKSSKILLQWAIFVQSMRIDLKKYGGVIFHDTEQRCKIWISPDLVVSKIGNWNWVNLHYSTQKSEKLYIGGHFLSKGYNVSARKFQRDYVPWHWRVYNAKFKGKLTCGLKNDIRNLVNFRTSRQKFSKFAQSLIKLIKSQIKFQLKKVQKNYFSWHWKKIQTLKKNCLFAWKMTSEIWWTLTRAVERLKICTLMDYFCRKCVMFQLKKYRETVLWEMTYVWFQKWHK